MGAGPGSSTGVSVKAGHRAFFSLHTIIGFLTVVLGLCRTFSLFSLFDTR
jgi:hypothetical protein